MKIASVIVDVPSLGTNKEFDYLIPEKWRNMIEPGMRVAVPFGPRKIQGFVMELKNKSSFDQLKEISDVLDIVPVLNEELIQLGNWLAEETLSFKISAYHAMLPAAMKAKYAKKIVRIDDSDNPVLHQLFQGQSELSWEDAEERGILTELKKEIKVGSVELAYVIKNRARKKMVKTYQIIKTLSELKEILANLRANAVAQKKLITYLLEHTDRTFSGAELVESVPTTSSAIQSLVQKEILLESEEEVYRDPYQHKKFQPSQPHVLTEEQAAVMAPILQSIKNNDHQTFLLYGVTGSGKTEVYLQSIADTLHKGKEAIVLVPEISLTPMMVDRFKSRFGKDVAVLHSGLSTGEKYDEWRKIQRKEARVVVGARSAIFAPLENIGIIIIDEEHENSYKQEEAPRYHARDVAIQRARYHNCPVILGSATPSLETFARAQKGVYHQLTLSKRMNNQDLPSVSIIDMREELRDGNRSMFSKELYEKIEDRLEKEEQIILFLNKRGYSTFMLCRDCGYVMQCPYCDISMTYHRASNEMKCHYCGHNAPVPQECPECTSQHIRYFGTGTQKVEEELNKQFPYASVIRMDNDTTSRKGAHEKLLDQFKTQQASILLGTQMIAKGLDFPNVTLVGVLTADTMLNLPDFRASEKTFQLLTQVSGRAGRHHLPGEVVIQTYTPEHYSVELAGEQDYDEFYRKEMLMRKLGAYPPYYYLAMITTSHEDLLKVMDITEKITSYIKTHLSHEAKVLGPTASPIPRINNRYRFQCLIKYRHEPELKSHLRKITNHYQQQFGKEGLTISVDVNPYMMM